MRAPKIDIDSAGAAAFLPFAKRQLQRLKKMVGWGKRHWELSSGEKITIWWGGMRDRIRITSGKLWGTVLGLSSGGQIIKALVTAAGSQLKTVYKWNDVVSMNFSVPTPHQVIWSKAADAAYYLPNSVASASSLGSDTIQMVRDGTAYPLSFDPSYSSLVRVASALLTLDKDHVALSTRPVQDLSDHTELSKMFIFTYDSDLDEFVSKQVNFSFPEIESVLADTGESVLVSSPSYSPLPSDFPNRPAFHVRVEPDFSGLVSSGPDHVNLFTQAPLYAATTMLDGTAAITCHFTVARSVNVVQSGYISDGVDGGGVPNGTGTVTALWNMIEVELESHAFAYFVDTATGESTLEYHAQGSRTLAVWMRLNMSDGSLGLLNHYISEGATVVNEAVGRTTSTVVPASLGQAGTYQMGVTAYPSGGRSLLFESKIVYGAPDTVGPHVSFFSAVGNDRVYFTSPGNAVSVYNTVTQAGTWANTGSREVNNSHYRDGVLSWSNVQVFPSSTTIGPPHLSIRNTLFSPHLRTVFTYIPASSPFSTVVVRQNEGSEEFSEGESLSSGTSFIVTNSFDGELYAETKLVGGTGEQRVFIAGEEVWSAAIPNAVVNPSYDDHRAWFLPNLTRYSARQDPISGEWAVTPVIYALPTEPLVDGTVEATPLAATPFETITPLGGA